jgi:AcrR family transcriptional regulator
VAKAKSKPLHLGRPRSEVAVSHSAIMDAVYELLKERPARDLTMDAVARRANVGKPTLYKWWPSKAALIMAMFHERLAGKFEAPKTLTTEKALRAKMRHLINACNGLFGKVIADLIAEGQGDPSILNELYENHIRLRRDSTVAEIERGIASGELSAQTDPELLIDAIFAPVYYRLLLRFAPLTEAYGDRLIDQALVGAARPRKKPSSKP